jgi:peptidoglycan/xylan/chitin deacetylase (PgdA/CDA1 family)
VKGAHTTLPVVAVTFDDGPDPATTPQVLDTLARARAAATFFLLVERAEANPALVRRLVEEGHEVGLHGIDHTRLTTLPRGEVRRRLVEGRARLAAVAGVPVRLFRPPRGAQSFATYLATRAAGLRPVVWSVDSGDWTDTAIDGVVARVGSIRPGGVVVLHDTLVVTEDDATPPSYDRAAMVSAVLCELAARGVASVTVSELLAAGTTEHSFWFRA